MSVVRLLARPLLAAPFVVSGVDAAVHPDAKADPAGEARAQLAKKLPVTLPDDPVQLARINGAVQAVAGLMLATGRMPRVAALALIATTLPTAYAGNQFWKEGDPNVRAASRAKFLKETSVLGGLLVVAVDTGGRPSLAHLGKDAVHRASHKVPGRA
ncbi:MAG: DoxX family protein [Frankiaceae bacterium]